MWNAIFVVLALVFAGLALWSPFKDWNALFWVVAAGFLAVLAFSASGAIGHRRAEEERAEKAIENGP